MKLKKQVQEALSNGNYATILEIGTRHTGQVIAALINTLSDFCSYMDINSNA